MQSRLRLLMGATALLYLGPLLAGLGGFGWAMVPLFVAIFVLWLFILRPHQWPRTAAEWRKPSVLGVAITQVLVQVLLVAILFGIGRGLGGGLGLLLPFPALLPLAISFLSIPLSRLIWNPWKAAQIDQFLDQALRQIHAPPPAYQGGRIALAQQRLAPLFALPDDTPEAEICRQLDAIGMATDETALRAALLDRVNAELPSQLELRALILHATDGRLIEIVGGDGPTVALAALTSKGAAPELIALFARRLTAALDEDHDLWGPSPSVSRLEEVLETYAGTGAEQPLRYLIDATNRAAPEDGLN
jgi:hypothetical protein